MARIASSHPITPKMYRQFAIATVGITATLAIFADGENRQAVATEVEQIQKKVEADQTKRQQATLLRRSNTQPARARNERSGFGEPDGNFGEPMDGSASSGALTEFELTTPSGSPRFGNLTPGGYEELGLSPEELAELTPAQKDQLLRELQLKRAKAASEMAEKSLERSGRTGPSTDDG